MIPFNNWIGGTSNNWNEPSNWDANVVPTVNNPGFTVINSEIRTPTLSAVSSVNNLVLSKGASYKASVANPLAVHGKLYNKITGATIDLGGSMTIFSSTDFKTDRIAPESVDYSITATAGAAINLQWEQATDDQSSATDLEYAVVMSTYSQNCVDTLAHIAENITPCAIETVIPFQTVAGSGTGETVRSAGGNIAEVDILGLESGNYYFNVLVRDEMNNVKVYESISSTIVSQTPTEIVMYSIGTSNGNIGDRSQADVKCSSSQDKPSGYNNYKMFIAYSGNDSPASWLPSGIPIKSKDGTVIADNKTDLTDSSIDVTLEAANLTTESYFWSGMEANLTISSGGYNCNDWSSSSSSGFGEHGMNTKTNSDWISAYTAAGRCDYTLDQICVAW